MILPPEQLPRNARVKRFELDLLGGVEKHLGLLVLPSILSITGSFGSIRAQ